MKNFCVIGSGRQGTAAAYDIVSHGNPKSLTVIDSNNHNLEKCKDKIKKLTNFDIDIMKIDINDENRLIKSLLDIDIFLSSVPYKFNLYLTDVAIKSKTSLGKSMPELSALD